MTFNVTANPTNRLGGLRRFAIAIAVLQYFGHTIFGFEQAWIQPLVYRPRGLCLRDLV